MKLLIVTSLILAANILSSCHSSPSSPPKDDHTTLKEGSSVDYYCRLNSLVHLMTHSSLKEKGTNMFGNAIFDFEGLDSAGVHTGIKYEVAVAAPGFSGTNHYGLCISEYSGVDTVGNVYERKLQLTFRGSERKAMWCLQEGWINPKSSRSDRAYQSIDPGQSHIWFEQMVGGIELSAKDTIEMKI